MSGLLHPSMGTAGWRLARRARRAGEGAPVGYAGSAELVRPVHGVDGWTLAGTALAGQVSWREERELCALLHAVDAGAQTPYTYARAAQVLERAGQAEQALAVLEAWLAAPAARLPRNSRATRSMRRRRDRAQRPGGRPRSPGRAPRALPRLLTRS